jgi:hypothetical protein
MHLNPLPRVLLVLGEGQLSARPTVYMAITVRVNAGAANYISLLRLVLVLLWPGRCGWRVWRLGRVLRLARLWLARLWVTRLWLARVWLVGLRLPRVRLAGIRLPGRWLS